MNKIENEWYVPTRQIFQQIGQNFDEVGLARPCRAQNDSLRVGTVLLEELAQELVELHGPTTRLRRGA